MYVSKHSMWWIWVFGCKICDLNNILRRKRHADPAVTGSNPHHRSLPDKSTNSLNAVTGSMDPQWHPRFFVSPVGQKIANLFLFRVETWPGRGRHPRAYTPCAPPPGPLSPIGGGGERPLFFSSPGTSMRICRKKITLWTCGPMGGDRGYFWNISKWTYIFEFF